MFIYFWRRERQSWAGEGQKEGDTESEVGSRLLELSAQSLTQAWTHELCEIITWAEVRRLTDWAIQVLSYFFFYFYLFIYFERQRKQRNMSRGGAEREGEEESQAGYARSAQSLMQTHSHELWDHIMTSAESKSWILNQLSLPGTLLLLLIPTSDYVLLWSGCQAECIWTEHWLSEGQL